MGYDAAALGERELALGRAFIDSIIDATPFPLLAANLSDPKTGERITKTFEIVELGAQKIGVIGLTMKLSPGGIDTSEFRIEDPIQWARQLVPEVRTVSDRVVVLAHLGWGGAFALAQQVEGIDIIVSGHGSHSTNEPQRVGKTLLLQAGNKGKKVGLLELTGSIRDGKYDGELVGLTKSIPEDVEMQELASQYTERIKDIYSRSSRKNMVAPQATQIRQRFTGAEQCRSCHSEIFNRWLESRHAHAMTSLVEKGKQFDPECVRCHSTGFKRPSGFISLRHNPDLANVQCEQCHAPGSLHVLFQKEGKAGLEGMSQASIERAINFGGATSSVCLKCHTPARDPDFTYKQGDLTGIH